MTPTNIRNAATPTLFASVRGSRDLALYAFAGALLTAAALHLGAFIPRFASPEGAPPQAPAVQPATPAPAPAAVVASQPVPCGLPRG